MRKGFKMTALLSALLLAVSIFSGCSSKKVEKVVVLEEDFGAEEYGIGFRNEDIAFGLKVQEIMDEMLSDGTAAEISKKWFDEDILLRSDSFIEESTAPAGDKSLDNILSKGKLVLGLDDSFPPMGFRDEKGNIVGLDIDLATEVAKRLDVELVLQPIDWDAKELELSTGKIDCIWNGMTINDERVGAMFFTKPYVANRQIVVVPEGSKIKTKADLKGKIVGLQKGSSSLDALNTEPDIASNVKEIVEYPNNVEAFMDLKAGRIEAFVVDEVAGRYIIATDGNIAE